MIGSKNRPICGVDDEAGITKFTVTEQSDTFVWNLA